MWHWLRKILDGEKTAKAEKTAVGDIKNDNNNITVRLDTRAAAVCYRKRRANNNIRPTEITGVRIDRRRSPDDAERAEHAIRKSSRRWLIATIAVQIL